MEVFLHYAPALGRGCCQETTVIRTFLIFLELAALTAFIAAVLLIAGLAAGVL